MQNQFKCQLLTPDTKVERRAKHAIPNILLFYALRRLSSFGKTRRVADGARAMSVAHEIILKRPFISRLLFIKGSVSSCMLGYGTPPSNFLSFSNQVIKRCENQSVVIFQDRANHFNHDMALDQYFPHKLILRSQTERENSKI